MLLALYLKCLERYIKSANTIKNAKPSGIVKRVKLQQKNPFGKNMKKNSKIQ